MSRKKTSEGESWMRSFDCDRCGAPAGMACTKPSGANTYAHASRFEQATEAGFLPLPDEQQKASE